MRKMTREEEEYYMPFLEEADRDIAENGTIPWEEVLEEWEEEERREKLYTKQNVIKLHLANWLGKISKKFVKA